MRMARRFGAPLTRELPPPAIGATSVQTCVCARTTLANPATPHKRAARWRAPTGVERSSARRAAKTTTQRGMGCACPSTTTRLDPLCASRGWDTLPSPGTSERRARQGTSERARASESERGRAKARCDENLKWPYLGIQGVPRYDCYCIQHQVLQVKRGKPVDLQKSKN